MFGHKSSNSGSNNSASKNSSSTGMTSGAQTDFNARGQTQYMGGDGAISRAMSGVNKGGMRALGLVFIMKKELKMQSRAIGLAEKYLEINRKDYEFFSQKILSRLGNLKDEVFGSSNPYQQTPDFNATALAGMAKVSVVDKAYAEKMRAIPKYNIGQKIELTYEMGLARKMAMAAGWGMAYRYEINRMQDRNNRAWAKKLAFSNLGLGIANITTQGLSNAVGNLSTAYNRKADAFGAFGNGLSTLAGYAGERMSTRDMMTKSDAPKQTNNRNRKD